MNPSFLTRKEAADILHCSTKTIDRYIQSGKLGFQKQGGQVYLLSIDVQNFYAQKFSSSPFVSHMIAKETDVSSSESPAPEPVKSDSEDEETPQKSEQIPPIPPKSTGGNLTIIDRAMEEIQKNTQENILFYKDMIQEMREEIKEKNTRLEAANYKIGELQSELNGRIPLLEYKAKDEEIMRIKIEMSKQAYAQEQNISLLQSKLKEEQMNKYIYAALVFFLGIL